MMFKFLKIISIGFILSVKKLLPILFLFTGFQANAGVIGNLTYDGTHISGDGRTYLGLDTIAAWDWATTLAATRVNGEYEDYRIANNADADYFIGSLFGADADSCSTVDGAPTYVSNCGTLQGWTDGVFGDTFNPNVDLIKFIASESSAHWAGILSISSSGLVHQNESWVKYNTGRGKSKNWYDTVYNAPTTWLLVMDTVASVPEPSILALMALGIFGIGFARRRRQS
jgi:hypothetical protein